VFLKENEDQFGESIVNWMKELELQFFYYTAFAQTKIQNKAVKRKYFETLHKTIESILIQLGESFRSTDYAQKVEQQLLDLIYSNLTPNGILQPKENISNHFLRDMLGKLAKNGFISSEFKNEQTQINWIHGAFNVDFYTDNQLNNFQLKINWDNLNNLADWLLFLKNSCIVYEHENNKQLLDWVIEHTTYKKQEFSRGSKIYESLIRSIKLRKKFIGNYMKIDQNGLFITTNFIPPSTNQ